MIQKSNFVDLGSVGLLIISCPYATLELQGCYPAWHFDANCQRWMLGSTTENVGSYLLQIKVGEQIYSPKVVRGDTEVVEVWLSPEMSYSTIETFLAKELSSTELIEFKNLWLNDSHNREFQLESDHLIIKDKSN